MHVTNGCPPLSRGESDANNNVDRIQTQMFYKHLKSSHFTYWVAILNFFNKCCLFAHVCVCGQVHRGLLLLQTNVRCTCLFASGFPWLWGNGTQVKSPQPLIIF